MKMLIKRVFCILCSLVLVFSLWGISASAEDAAWIPAYRAVLDQLLTQLSGQDSYGITPECSYLLYDIDKDGTPEMAVKYGTCEADYAGRIFTFRNGQALTVGEEFGLSHSSFYSYPDGNGIIVMQGHMGFAWAGVIRLEGENSYRTEELYEDDLNSRLQSDPEAWYVYPGDVIPGSVYLTLCRAELSLPLTHYEEIEHCLKGELSSLGNAEYPEQDALFFEKLTAGNGEVFAVTADGFTNSPGQIGFAQLLEEDVAAPYMGGNIKLLGLSYGDLNADGQLEALASMSVDSDYGGKIYCILSEQAGRVYAYLINYMNDLEITADGSLLHHSEWEEKPVPYRLIFDGPEAYLLYLPG